MSRRLAPAARVEQLDLFAELETAAAEAQAKALAEAPVPNLYGSPTRGLAARMAEFDAWRDAYGDFGCIPISHAWHEGFSHSTTPTDRCAPSLLQAELRCLCNTYAGNRCLCVGDLMYRGACRHCTWEGDPTDSENTASEDAHDHAWPGWRDLPLVPRSRAGEMGPAQQKRAAVQWLEKVTPLYPPGWVEAGGPVRTARSSLGTRHVPNGTPFGGYDMAASQ